VLSTTTLPKTETETQTETETAIETESETKNIKCDKKKARDNDLVKGM